MKATSFLVIACALLPMAARAALILPDLPDVDGMGVKGFVHNGAAPLAGVQVTDGYSIAFTADDGSYYLPCDSRAETVYVCTPAGYNPECYDGLCKFWTALPQDGTCCRADFRLTATADDTEHTAVVVADPQMRDDHDHAMFKSQALPDIKESVADIHAQGREPVILVLGDMCFNNPETFQRYAAYWQATHTPMYHVPGNHDKHLVAQVQAQAPEYKDVFGPLYYSFTKGKVHYLMLDNIYIGVDDTYAAILDAAQLEWVLKDLEHVPDDYRLVVCLHQPTTWTETSRRENARLLERLN